MDLNENYLSNKDKTKKKVLELNSRNKLRVLFLLYSFLCKQKKHQQKNVYFLPKILDSIFLKT